MSEPRTRRGLRRAERTLLHCSQTLESEPANIAVLLKRSDALTRLSRFSDSLADLDKILEVSADHVDACKKRSHLLTVHLGRHSEAFSSMSSYLESHPQDHFALFVRGHALMRLSRLDESVSDLTRSLRLDTRSPLYRLSRGELYVLREEHHLAVSDLQRLIELSPTYVDVWRAYCLLGVCHSAMNQIGKAVRAFSKSIELNSEVAITFLERGNCFLAWKRFEDAVGDYSKAINLDQSEIRAYLRRASVVIAHPGTGLSEKEALEDLNKALELWELPESVAKLGSEAEKQKLLESLYADRATAHKKLQLSDLAIQDYTRLLELNPTRADAFLNRGILVLMCRVDHDSAKEDFRNAIAHAENKDRMKQVIESVTWDGFYEEICYCCAQCRNSSPKMSVCGRCKQTFVSRYYCSRVCQRKHWPLHKPGCLTPAEREKRGPTKLIEARRIDDPDDDDENANEEGQEHQISITEL